MLDGTVGEKVQKRLSDVMNITSPKQVVIMLINGQRAFIKIDDATPVHETGKEGGRRPRGLERRVLLEGIDGDETLENVAPLVVDPILWGRRKDGEKEGMKGAQCEIGPIF